MKDILLLVHMITLFALIIFILLQRGKGASMGASFGAGASETMFGALGTTSIFAKITSVLAVIFFSTSLWLAVLSRTDTDIETEYDLESDVSAPAIYEPLLEQPATDAEKALDDGLELPERS